LLRPSSQSIHGPDTSTHSSDNSTQKTTNTILPNKYWCEYCPGLGFSSSQAKAGHFANKHSKTLLRRISTLNFPSNPHIDHLQASLRATTTTTTTLTTKDSNELNQKKNVQYNFENSTTLIIIYFSLYKE
jgi:hypothetical protein